ncbi:MAG: hypothetical protein QME44_04550 [Thermodesulfobacteriota bacterium]|nr:hypothetical protein [Thermodesulfobacteriota bacterium]
MRERTITIMIILAMILIGTVSVVIESIQIARQREADMHLRYQIMLLEKDLELLEAEGRLLEYMAEVEPER